jgi:hypothetical protein
VEGIANLMAEQQATYERIAQEEKHIGARLADMELSIKQEQQRSRTFAQLLSQAYNRQVEEVHRNVLAARDAVTAFEQLALGSTLRTAREAVGARMIGKHIHAWE